MDFSTTDYRSSHKKTGFSDFWEKTKLPIEFFNFFSILEIWRHAPPPQNQVFSRCLKNGDFLPNHHIDIGEI